MIQLLLLLRELNSNDPVAIQSLSHVQLFVAPWTAAHQASLSFTISQSLPRLIFIESVMLSNHLVLCLLLLHLLSIFASLRVFLSELALCIRWPKYWSFSISFSPSNEYSRLISLGLSGLIPLQSRGLSRIFCSPTIEKHQFFSA